MSKSSRDVGKTKKLKQTAMGQFLSSSGASSKKKHKNSKGKMTFWGSSSARDTEDYRDGYPNKKDDKDLDANARFYKNELVSKPDGALIEDMLKDWWGNYKLLERHHGYIQWLFPIREDGMNWHAQELQKHEIEKICEDKEAHARVLKAYKMMLDFYGMKLEDDESGKIERAENWKERFEHLNKSFHNYLRITRILKCLGELGYEQLKKPFIEFILHEAMVEETLPNLLNSCYNYWINVLRDDDERLDMWKLYQILEEQSSKSSDEEEIESNKRAKMNENGLKPTDLKTSENGNDTVMEQEEPKQEDKVDELTDTDDQVVLMEVESDKNESNEKSKIKEESENELNSAELKVSENKEELNKQESKELIEVSESDVLMEEENEKNESDKVLKVASEKDEKSANLNAPATENGKEQEVQSQEHINEESPKVFGTDALMHTENENKDSCMIPKVESANNENSANLNASANEKVSEQGVSSQESNIEKLTQMDDSAILLKAGNEKNENSWELKMKVESENELNSAELKVSENKELNKQESKEFIEVSESDVLMEEETEKNESDKILKVESEKDEKSANLNAPATENGKEQEVPSQEHIIEESPKVVGSDALMHTENENKDSCMIPKVESENNENSANLNASANEKVSEQGVSSQESNIEKLTQMDDSAILLKAGNEKNENSWELKMKVESENEFKSVNLKASANEEVIEGGTLTQACSVEKASKVYDPDMLLEAEDHQVCNNGLEVTKRHHEQSDSEMDGQQKGSETPLSSESESVEMTDDSQRQTGMQDKQIDSASETPETSDEQQASLSQLDSVMHVNHSNQKRNSEEYHENSF